MGQVWQPSVDMARFDVSQMREVGGWIQSLACVLIIHWWSVVWRGCLGRCDRLCLWQGQASGEAQQEAETGGLHIVCRCRMDTDTGWCILGIYTVTWRLCGYSPGNVLVCTTGKLKENIVVYHADYTLHSQEPVLLHIYKSKLLYNKGQGPALGARSVLICLLNLTLNAKSPSHIPQFAPS